jgi:hypothetical protein
MPRDLPPSRRREGQPRCTIRVRPTDSIEASASVLSVIAYPKLGDAKEDGRRQRFYRALRAQEIRERCDEDPDFAWTPQLVRPGLLTLDPGLVARRVNEGMHRIFAWRVPAAEIAAWRLIGLVETGGLSGEALERANAVYKENRRKTSTNRLSAMIARRVGTDPKDVMHRYWASTKPVLHLAMKVRSLIMQREDYLPKRPPKTGTIAPLVISSRWLLQQRFSAAELAQAEIRRHMLVAVGVLKAEETIRVLPRE